MTRSTQAVFLSYASEDAVPAQRICATLSAAGIEPWFDQSELTSPTWREFGLPLGYHAQARTAEANAALATLLHNSAGSEYQVAEIYAYFGDRDNAFLWLNRAAVADPGIQWLRGDPLLRPLTGDPRYAALLHKLNLPAM